MKLKTKVINFRVDVERLGILDEAVNLMFPAGTRADLINAALDKILEPIMADLERLAQREIDADKAAGRPGPSRGKVKEVGKIVLTFKRKKRKP